MSVLPLSMAGEHLRYLARAPDSDRVCHLSEGERFICTRLDGHTSLQTIAAEFESRFDRTIPPHALQAFVSQLHAHGLLVTDIPVLPPSSEFERLRELPIPADRFFTICNRLGGWFFSKAFRVCRVLLLVLSLAIVWTYRELLARYLVHFPDAVESLAQRSGPTNHAILQLTCILLVIPVVREIAKGTACRRMGCQVGGIRQAWFMWVVPYIVVDIRSGAILLNRNQRMRIAAAGIEVELFLFSVATLAYEMVRTQTAEKDFFLSLAVASAISFLFNANPLLPRDGSHLLSLYLDQPQLTRRATKTFHAWLRGAILPEPLDASGLRLHLRIGALCDLFKVLVHALIFWLLWTMLTGWFGGFGAFLFLLLLVQRVLDEIRSPTVSMKTGTRRHVASWLWGIGIVVVLFGVSLIPYPREVGGEFRVRASEQREIRAEVASTIESIGVEAGMWVRQGDPLAQLSQRTLQRELESARVTLRRERSTLELVAAGASDEVISAAEQRVIIAETRFKHTDTAYRRVVELHEQGHVSDQDYDTARRAMEVDREALELERRTLDVVTRGVVQAQLDAQAADVERLEMTVAYLEEDLPRTTINSPLDGQVTTPYLQHRIGQKVAVGDLIAIVANTSNLVLRIALPEHHAGRIDLGARVRARTWAYPDEIIEGYVTSVLPVVMDTKDDEVQRAVAEQKRGAVRSLNAPEENIVPVLVEIPNPDGKLKLDMSGYAKISTGTTPLGVALFDPVFRFFRVKVWSWIP